MSVYKPKGSKTYVYDFELRGRRFCGNTGAASKREAEGCERQKRAEAAEETKRRIALRRDPLTVKAATSRYWTEIGQHHKGADNTLWSLEWLEREIGPQKKIRDITDEVISRLVTQRRSEGVGPATVNRSMTEPLRKILRRAAEVWGEPLPRIRWTEHLLKEPRERVRELRDDEEKTLFDAIRPDYVPIIQFALMSGCRLSECVGLTWADVDWGGRLIWVNGKGGKRASIPMAPALRKLLWPLQGHHPESVFTYLAVRGSAVIRRGARMPITREGLKTTWRRLKIDAKLVDYRFHDNRHTAATRILRQTGNLAAVKRLLRHEKIDTTMRYAHVTDDDLRDAIEATATRNPVNSPIGTKTDKAENE